MNILLKILQHHLFAPICLASILGLMLWKTFTEWRRPRLKIGRFDIKVLPTNPVLDKKHEKRVTVVVFFEVRNKSSLDNSLVKKIYTLDGATEPIERSSHLTVKGNTTETESNLSVHFTLPNEEPKNRRFTIKIIDHFNKKHSVSKFLKI